ncbi:MAG: hypothetical protein C4576_13780 [Desulfobacteraceae bacterium]|nr:MAG: hypothetical protein C4576_13780 [Desulfobacteraceae bacterium]
MGSFKDFFFSNDAHKKDLPSLESSMPLLAGAIIGTMATINTGSLASKSKKTKFGTKVSQLAHSEVFIQELSDKIGNPHSGESEDDFTERAKKTMKALLKERLGK